MVLVLPVLALVLRWDSRLVSRLCWGWLAAVLSVPRWLVLIEGPPSLGLQDCQAPQLSPQVVNLPFQCRQPVPRCRHSLTRSGPQHRNRYIGDTKPGIQRLLLNRLVDRFGHPDR